MPLPSDRPTSGSRLPKSSTAIPMTISISTGPRLNIGLTPLHKSSKKTPTVEGNRLSLPEQRFAVSSAGDESRIVRRRRFLLRRDGMIDIFLDP